MKVKQATLKPTLTPKLRFPEFRKAGEWEAKTLANACDMQAGKFVRATDIKNQPASDLFPCYGGNGLRGYTSTHTHEGVYPLVGRQGALCGNVKLCTGRFHATEHAVVSTPKKGIDVRWLYYALDLLNLNRFATGQAQPGLSVDVLEKVALALPEQVTEQHKIASCLSSLDDLIAAERQKLDALKAHKMGLMQQLFPREGETRPRLRFPEFSNAGEWKSAKLGNHVKIGSGDSPSTFDLSSKGKYALVKVEDLNNCSKYQITGREFCDDADGVVPRDSVVFPKRGAAIELNKIRITAAEIRIDTNLMALTPMNGMAPEFLYYYIATVGLSHIADTSTIPQINNKHIIPFGVLLPAIPEQHRIASFLSSLDELIAAQSDKIESLKTHKKGLMQQLFPIPEE